MAPNHHRTNGTYLLPGRKGTTSQTGRQAPTLHRDDRHRPHTGTTGTDLAEWTKGTILTPRRKAPTSYRDDRHRPHTGQNTGRRAPTSYRDKHRTDSTDLILGRALRTWRRTNTRRMAPTSYQDARNPPRRRDDRHQPNTGTKGIDLIPGQQAPTSQMGRKATTSSRQHRHRPHTGTNTGRMPPTSYRDKHWTKGTDILPGRTLRKWRRTNTR